MLRAARAGVEGVEGIEGLDVTPNLRSMIKLNFLIYFNGVERFVLSELLDFNVLNLGVWNQVLLRGRSSTANSLSDWGKKDSNMSGSSFSV